MSYGKELTPISRQKDHRRGSVLWSNPYDLENSKHPGNIQEISDIEQSFDLATIDDRFVTKRKYRISEEPTQILYPGDDSISSLPPLASFKFMYLNSQYPISSTRARVKQGKFSLADYFEDESRTKIQGTDSKSWSNPNVDDETLKEMKAMLQSTPVKQSKQKDDSIIKTIKFPLAKGTIIQRRIKESKRSQSPNDSISDEIVESDDSSQSTGSQTRGRTYQTRRSPIRSRRRRRRLRFPRGPLNLRLSRPNRQLNRYIHNMFHSIINNDNNNNNVQEERMLITKSAIFLLNSMVKDIIKKFAETADQLMLYTGRRKMNNWVAVSVLKMLFDIEQFDKILHMFEDLRNITIERIDDITEQNTKTGKISLAKQ